jgi:hypothetical protein
VCPERHPRAVTVEPRNRAVLYSEILAMRLTPRLARGLVLALPVWLAAATAGAAPILTADINRDGVRDRIEAGRAPAELVIRLSNLGPAQHLLASGSILDVLVTDVDRDGNPDLVVTASGRRHVRLFVWTNAGGGKLVSKAPHQRQSLSCDRSSHPRLTLPLHLDPDDSACGDDGSLFVPASIDLRGRARVSEPVHVVDELASARARYDRPAPRGPPASLFSF